MSQYNRLVFVFSRICLCIIFLLNGLGIIDQTVAARELSEHGAPSAMVPLIMMAGRALEILGGVGLGLGVCPQWSALALLAFLVPATLISHSFWLAAGTPAFQGLLLQFSKNLAICGGLLCVAASASQPTLFPKRSMIPSAGKVAPRAA